MYNLYVIAISFYMHCIVYGYVKIHNILPTVKTD